jgi:ABC-type multidrug transport system ATPase subunit
MQLHIENLRRTHRASGFALGPVSFHLKPGECMAVLGRNGSGKSTLFEAITGHADIDEGEVRLGLDRMSPDQFMLKRRFGYLPQNPRLPPWVSAYELLQYASRMHQLASDAVERSLELWDCRDFAHKPISRCSYGMQKRIGLALATIHHPMVLILDEPFSGLDLYQLRTLEDVIRARSQQITILSTHVMSHAIELCHQVIALQQGQVIHLTSWGEDSHEERLCKITKTFFADS